MTGPTILKFGGTCLQQDAARRKAAECVQAAYRSGLQPVVVVSAMGRMGEPYATDTLLSLPHQLHCGQPNPREADALAAIGESLSCTLMASLLGEYGLPAVSLQGFQAGLYTDDNHQQARCTHMDPAPLNRILRQQSIPVVAGFQGISPTGDITTLGRGGSDTTAVLLGVHLKANAIYLYTDVDGVFTVDPKLLPNARQYTALGLEDLWAFACAGARIVHKTAAGLAAAHQIPLFVGRPQPAGLAAPSDAHTPPTPGSWILPEIRTPGVLGLTLHPVTAGPASAECDLIAIVHGRQAQATLDEMQTVLSGFSLCVPAQATAGLPTLRLPADQATRALALLAKHFGLLTQ